MKRIWKICTIVVLIILLFILMVCCSKGEEIQAPFSTLTWSATAEDVVALEGSDYKEGEPVYSGDCYTYAHEYKGMTGTLQYMFDEKGRLASVAWLCTSTSLDEIQSLYAKEQAEITEKYGEGGFDSQYASQIGGDVWYTDGGNIILLMSTVDEYQALQISYVNPRHALAKPNDSFANTKKALRGIAYFFE